ncbi:MAG: SDR family NAD(P)-dependent oxidoreductase, partial [Candidatus Sulfotelmatobacter sp.]
CGYGLAHELTDDAWNTMLDINLTGPWRVGRRVIPHMIAARRGVIINNSSVAGLRGMARLSHYAASKWGLVGLTKSWAIELAPHNFRVIALCPTGVNTPMNDGCYVESGSLLLPGSKLKLTFSHEHTNVTVAGEVVRMDMGIGAALKFIEATHEVRAAVQRMLEQLAAAEAVIDLKRSHNAAAGGKL